MAMTTANEKQTYFQGANTVHLEKQFTDWLFASGGYLYSQFQRRCLSGCHDDEPGLPVAGPACPGVERRRTSSWSATRMCSASAPCWGRGRA